MPLELHGRGEDNVPIFTGLPDGFSSWPWAFSIAVGLLLACIFLCAGIHAAVVKHEVVRSLGALALATLISGSVVVGSGWWLSIMRELPHLSSIDELAGRFGVETGA